MICGIGIDIIEVGRVREVAERHGDRFLRRIYTEAEIAGIHGNEAQYLAARFAAKEATLKALGTGWRGVRWVEVEIENLASGQPVLKLSGEARRRADSIGVVRCHVSLTHTAEYAAAQVVLEGRES